MKGIAKLGQYSFEFYVFKTSKQSDGNYKFIDCDFNEINNHLPENYKGLKPLLNTLTLSAHKQGVRKLLLPNITLHNAFYLFPEWLNGIELCDPLEQLAPFPSKSKAYILGSRYIHLSPVFNERIKNINLTPQPLNDETRKTVDTIRLNAYNNGYSPKDAINLADITQKLSQTHPVIIACSELSLSLAPHLSLPPSDKIIDLANVQIEKFLK